MTNIEHLEYDSVKENYETTECNRCHGNGDLDVEGKYEICSFCSGLGRIEE